MFQKFYVKCIVMNFNFNSLAETSFHSESTPRLSAYEIYKVNLSKIERGELKGTKDPNAVYDVVSLEFKEPETGRIYSENLFVPNREEDFERNSFNSGKPAPSRFERFQFTLMQIVEAISPEGAEKIKNNAGKLKTIDDFINIVIKALNGKDKVDVYLKLIGTNRNGSQYAALPNSCFINNDGKAVASNFISSKNNLTFSAYEMQKKKEFETAKPTNMQTVEKNNDNLDLEGLEF